MAPTAVAAAPEVCKIVVAGVTVVVGGVILVEIGENLGKTWDGIAENRDNFVSDITKGINNVINENRQYDATSQEITNQMIGLSSGGKPKEETAI